MRVVRPAPAFPYGKAIRSDTMPLQLSREVEAILPGRRLISGLLVGRCSLHRHFRHTAGYLEGGGSLLAPAGRDVAWVAGNGGSRQQRELPAVTLMTARPMVTDRIERGCR